MDTFDNDRQICSSIREIVFDSDKKNQLILFFKQNDLQISLLGLPVRATNALSREGVFTFSEALSYYPDGFSKIHNLGTKTIDIILRKIDHSLMQNEGNIKAYFNGNISSLPEWDIAIPKADVDLTCSLYELMCSSVGSNKIIEYFQHHNFTIKKMNLSPRSFNALYRAGYKKFTTVLELYPNGFYELAGIGTKSIQEIKESVEDYLEKNRKGIIAFLSGTPAEKEDTPTEEEGARPEVNATVYQLAADVQSKAKVVNHYRRHNISIERMGLSVRSKNALTRAGILDMASLLEIYPNGIIQIENLGTKSSAEIIGKIESCLQRDADTIIAYCADGESALFTEENIHQYVLDSMKPMGLSSCSMRDIVKCFPVYVAQDRIPPILDDLVAEGRLCYSSGKYYCVYPSFFDELDKATEIVTDKYITVLKSRLCGETLEEIGSKLGLTRERVRQLVVKALGLVCTREYYAEDFYRYLFEEYAYETELWNDYLCVSSQVQGYLKLRYKSGEKSLEDSIFDDRLDTDLRTKVQQYLAREMITLDGISVCGRRADVEDFVLEHYCHDERSFDSYVALYNQVLEKNGIPYNEELYYTNAILSTRANHLSELPTCLWKQNKRLRYYNTADHDFSELLETIDIENLKDTQISTQKWTEDYPELMEKYDIRDEYELHNLLKKIIGNNNASQISFKRQPIIEFGKFDRDAAVYNIMVQLSPVSAEDLANVIHREFGYNIPTIMGSVFTSLWAHYHDGIFSVDFKQMPEDRKTQFLSVLDHDFYFLEELRASYQRLFPFADIEEVNPFTLKSLGFNIFSTYALRNHPTAESYFIDMLTGKPLYDRTPLIKRYGSIQMFNQTLRTLREEYRVVFLDRTQTASAEYLCKLGITSASIRNYCEAVYNAVKEESYFTVHSLKKAGFHSELFDYDMDDYFYGSILTVDSRFRWEYFYGGIVLYKGQEKKRLAKSDFFLQMLDSYNSVTVDEFIELCKNTYGIYIADRYELTGTVHSANTLSYDPVTGIISHRTAAVSPTALDKSNTDVSVATSETITKPLEVSDNVTTSLNQQENAAIVRAKEKASVEENSKVAESLFDWKFSNYRRITGKGWTVGIPHNFRGSYEKNEILLTPEKESSSIISIRFPYERSESPISSDSWCYHRAARASLADALGIRLYNAEKHGRVEQFSTAWEDNMGFFWTGMYDNGNRYYQCVVVTDDSMLEFQVFADQISENNINIDVLSSSVLRLMETFKFDKPNYCVEKMALIEDPRCLDEVLQGNITLFENAARQIVTETQMHAQVMKEKLQAGLFGEKLEETMQTFLERFLESEAF